MTPLRVLQGRFAAALLDREREPPAEGARRFAVHRNNVQATLVAALAARFPVCRRLVGEAFFRAMAAVHVEMCPPRSPLLMRYGDQLPVFLELFPPTRALPYLPDVARLEIAVGEAYHAADAEPLAPAALAALAPDDWERLRVRLHPSVRVVASPYPVASIWAAHQLADAPAPVGARRGEDALVARVNGEVEVSRLPDNGGAFLARLLSDGSPLAAAEAVPKTDPLACVSLLASKGLIVGLL